MKPAETDVVLAYHQMTFIQFEIMKQAFLAGGDVLLDGFSCKEKIMKELRKIPPAYTCARRSDDFSRDLFQQLLKQLRICLTSSMAIDKSTDKSDTADLVISVRYFDKEVSEEFLSLISMKGTTRAADFSEALVNFSEYNRLHLDSLVSV